MSQMIFCFAAKAMEENPCQVVDFKKPLLITMKEEELQKPVLIFFDIILQNIICEKEGSS